MATPVHSLNATGQILTPPGYPSGPLALEHVWVYNPTAALAYLNLWALAASNGSPGITDITDQIPIGPGFCGLVYVGLPKQNYVTVSASTATNGTGNPTTGLELSVRWA